MKGKLLVLSVDAMVNEDVDYLFKKPHFSALFQDCCRVERMRSVYPSVTYPAHTSIITGCQPGRHGITDNDQWATVEGPEDRWFRSASAIQVEDLFAATKRVGRSTAAVYWPVTGGNPNIDYLIDEVFPSRDLGVEGILAQFASYGSDQRMQAILLSNMNRFPVHNRNQVGLRRHNTYDWFLNGCTADIIRRYAPDLTMVHNSYIDTARHRYGVFNYQVNYGLDLVDECIGELVSALREAGIYEDTNFVLVSDHGQMDFARRLRLNVKLVRDGKIVLRPDGTVESWRMFTKSTGMSAPVYLSDPKDPALYRESLSYLEGLVAEGVWGISKIYTRDQVRDSYGLDGDFSFILESDGCTAFADSWHEPIINPIDFSDYRLGKATHGYEPEKGPQPVFLAVGPAFRPGVSIPDAHLIDEGPTFASILGTDLPHAEGCCLEELLN